MMRALARLIPRWKHIEDIDNPADIYLSRLMLVKLSWLGIYLHVIRRPDWSRCDHDHPWAFVTCILWGGYVESVDGVEHTRRMGYVGYRPKSFTHRITLLRKRTAVTLVVRFRNHETWGFRTTLGYIDWQRYMSWPNAVRVKWCDDRREPAFATAPPFRDDPVTDLYAGLVDPTEGDR